MRMRRLPSAFLVAALACSSIPAFAEVAAPTSPTINSKLCENKEGRDRGRCISDVLNSLARQSKAFTTAQRVAHAAWHKEHDIEGLTDDYRKAHNTLHNEMNAAVKAYKKEELRLRREFQNEQDAFKRSQSGQSTGYGRNVKGEDFHKAEEVCKKKTDARDRRICLRQALQLRDPAVKPWFER